MLATYMTANTSDQNQKNDPFVTVYNNDLMWQASDCRFNLPFYNGLEWRQVKLSILTILLIWNVMKQIEMVLKVSTTGVWETRQR